MLVSCWFSPTVLRHALEADQRFLIARIVNACVSVDIFIVKMIDGYILDLFECYVVV